MVTDGKNEVLMRGVRFKNNFYLWASQEINGSPTCLVSKEDEVNLWHHKLRHLHLKGMKKIVSKEAIIGIPKLKTEEGKIYGEYQIRKQTNMSHPKLQYQTTSKVLEFLHMNCGNEGSLMSNTFMCLKVNVTFRLTVSKEERWILRVMKEYFWTTLQTT